MKPYTAAKKYNSNMPKVLSDGIPTGKVKKRKTLGPQVGDRYICIDNTVSALFYMRSNIGQVYTVAWAPKDSYGESNRWIHTAQNNYMIDDFMLLPETKLTKLLFD